MLNEYLPFLLYALVVLGVGVGAITVSTLLQPRRTYSKVKFEPYECGVDQLENPHKPFSLKFYTFALLLYVLLSWVAPGHGVQELHRRRRILRGAVLPGHPGLRAVLHPTDPRAGMGVTP